MPQAAAHILIPLTIASLFRDYLRKKGYKIPLHYVLIAGLAGILPDLDVAAFWVLNFFGFTLEQVHRTFVHTIFVPLFFILLALLMTGKDYSFKLGKHTLRWSIVFWMISFGTISHLLLDVIFAGKIMPFYPFSSIEVGINLFGYLPFALQEIASPSLDAALLIIWLVYLEIKHKISDFI